MKILRLRFLNINSLKGLNSIDFTESPLKDTGIFAITGATGAGKSTILDAITLALYNCTPRTQKLSKKDIEEFGSIITKHTNECWVEVEYESKNKQYRSKWEISRTRTGTLREYHMEIAELADNKLLALKKGEVPAKNAEIIGLDYEQFVKSVLLSQGDFAKFLKANASERGDLLEKITGTEIYRQIGKAAFEKQKEEKTKLDALQTQFNSIQLLTEEQIQSFENQLIETENQLIVDNQSLKVSTEHLQIKQAIEKFREELSKLEIQYESVKNQQISFQSQQQKLEQHEKLFALKSEITTYLSLSDSLQKETEKLATIKQILDNQTLSELKDKQIWETLNLEKQEILTRHTNLKPILEEVKELDNQIRIVHQKVKDQQEQVELKIKELEYQRIENQLLENTIQRAKTEKQNVELWLIENGILQDLEKEMLSIEQQAGKVEKFGLILKTSLDESRNSSFYNEVMGVKSWNERKLKVEFCVESLRVQLENLSNESTYKAEQFADLQKEKENLRNQKLDIDQQLFLAKEFVKRQRELDKIQILHQDEKEILETKTADLQSFSNELEIAEKYVEEYRIRFERQKLEAKYADDRKRLKISEPCYLCGSTSHPYVENYVDEFSQTQHILIEKENEVRALHLNIQNLTKEIAKAETNVNNFQKQMISYKESMNELEIQFLSSSRRYQHQINITQIASLQSFLEDIGLEINEKQYQLECLEGIRKLESELQKLESLYKDFDNFLFEYEGFQSYQAKYSVCIQAEVKKMNDWIDLAQRAKNEFLNRKELFSKLSNHLETQQKLLEEKQILEDKLLKNKDLASESLQTIQSELNQLKADRISKLGVKPIETIESEIQTEIQANTAKITNCEKLLTRIESEIKGSKNSISELEQSISEFSQKIQAQEEFLLPQIKSLGYDSISLVNLLNDKEVEQIKSDLKRINETKISIEQSIKDKRADLENEQVKEQSFDTQKTNNQLFTEISELNASLESGNQKIGTLRTQLEDDKRKRLSIKDVRQGIENQRLEFQRWNILNDLVGDKEGKRFSKFAQELTLVQLIQLANKHLRNLNERYIIKSNDTSKDDLVIIDRFQGNVERSVRTLSGGESFLTSLALALGLSDLAGQNTKIECLFIDEGFGSLDQITLDTALSALERLQLETNRTIGIISHIDSMKERIKTQIELKKSNTGYSTIEVKIA